MRLFINGVEFKYQKFFRPKKAGKYNILLYFNINIKDCSFMFYKCNNIINIDLSLFPSKNIMNMFAMFSGCTNLKYIDLYFINTKM